jgi:hypothetical protein
MKLRTETKEKPSTNKSPENQINQIYFRTNKHPIPLSDV